MYSQNNEDEIIISYFESQGINISTINVLEVGCNDCKTLSNSLALIERGASAVLIDPSKTAYNKCKELHLGRSKVYCYNFAIGDFCGEATFHESGSHLGVGDTALLSTLKESELKRWEGSDNTFTETVTKVFDFVTFLKKSKIKKFDFISLDAEGNDILILQQIDMLKIECKVLCIEWNSIPEVKAAINEITNPFGFILVHQNPENLIYTKN